MRLGAIPQNITESIGLATGSVPTPLMDTLVALLLARTIMTAASVGIFQALDSQPLTADEIAKRCETDPQATKRLIRALFGCKYLNTKTIVSPWPPSRAAGCRRIRPVPCIRPSYIAIWTCAS